MRSRESAEPKKRQSHGNIGRLRQPANLFSRAGQNDPVSRQDHRSLRFIDQRGRLVQFCSRRKEIRHLAMSPGRGRIPIEFAGTELRVFSDVHEHRAGPVGRRNLKGFAQADGDFVGACNEIIVLGNGNGDARDVCLLERVAPQDRAAHLARDAHDRRGVHHGRGDSCHHVGCARPGRRQRHTHTAARTRISVRHVRSPLFMPHQYVVDSRLGQGIVGREDGASGIPEDVLHSQPLQAFPDDLGAGQLSWGIVAGRLLVHQLLISSLGIPHK